jgi:hypothetical protein
MSDNIGFLVVNQTNGYLVEGKDHAAKVFETLANARSAISALQKWMPVRLRYTDAVRSLLKGSALCFDTEDCHRKFLKRVRNDATNKAFLTLSQDRNFVRWRTIPHDPNANPAASVVSDAIAQTAPASGPPVETPAFNPAVLVREGNR